MRATVWCLALSLLVGSGCSGGGSPAADPASTSTPSSARAGPLEGSWATGPIRIADLKASMVDAGLAPSEANAWAIEVGSPSQYAFVLNFTGSSFTHSEETPEMAMQVGESGSFEFSGARLKLTVGQPGNIDTNTFEATIQDDELSLRRLDSSEQGTAADKAKHLIYTLAFYCSAPFIRQP